MASNCVRWRSRKKQRNKVQPETYVVRSMAVIIETTEECRSGVLSYILLQEIGSTGMFVEEVADVMDIPSNADQRPRLCLTLVWEANCYEQRKRTDQSLTVFPSDDWQIQLFRRPGECLLFLAKALELDSQLAFLYFVVRKRL